MFINNDGQEGPSEIKQNINIFGNHEDDSKVTIEEFKDASYNGKSWTLIHGNVYNMESMLKAHPGGKEAIEDIIGKDGTDLFDENHEDSASAKK